MFSAGKTETKKILCLTLSICAVWFGAAVWLFPGYYLDDYMIFALLKQRGFLPPSDPQFPFYLHFRPLTYLYLGALSIFSSMPIIIKTVQIALLLITLVIAYRFIEYLLKQAGYEIRQIFLLLPLFLLITQPDTLLQILWISNFNELLSLFFYLLSLRLFQNSTTGKNRKLLILFSAAAFIAAVLSKQQPLHLPILAGLALLMFPALRGNYSRRDAWLIFLAGILSAVVFSFWHAAGSAANTGLINYLWIKPFAAAETLLYMLFPSLFPLIHSAVSTHKIFTALIFLAAAAGIFAMIKRNQKILLLKIFILTLAVFFPRFFYEAGERLNSIQLFWLALAAALLLHRFAEKKNLLVIAICVLIAGNMYASFNKINYLRTDHRQQEQSVFDLKQFIACEDSCIVVMPNVPIQYGYAYHYITRGSFGNAGFTTAPLYYIKGMNYADEKPVLTITRSDSVLTCTSLDPEITLDTDRLRGWDVMLKSIANNGRGYSSLSLIIPQQDRLKYIYYYDGGRWRRL